MKLTGDVSTPELITYENVILDPWKDVTLRITEGSLVLLGDAVLRSKPKRGRVHRIIFEGVDASLFHPGAMPAEVEQPDGSHAADPHDPLFGTDRGLWVLDGAALDISPAAASATWSRTAPTEAGWVQVGDEWVWPTRQVYVEGVNAHVFVHSSAKQVVKYAALVGLGPRGLSADGEPEGVKGRYALHFHLCECGGPGVDSEVIGVLADGCQNHAFVPHGVTGVMYRDCVALNCRETNFWWDSDGKDPVSESHGIRWEHCLAAGFYCEPGDENRRTVAGFNLGNGSDCHCVGCVAVGGSDGEVAAGFSWKTGGDTAKEAVWDFAGCEAYGNSLGIWVYQNSGRQHRVDDFIAHGNRRAAVDHGAYRNAYVYEDCVFRGSFDNGCSSKLGDGGDVLGGFTAEREPLTFRNVLFDADGDPWAFLQRPSQQPWAAPTRFVNCQFTGFSEVALQVIQADPAARPVWYQFEGCAVDGRPLEVGDLRAWTKTGVIHPLHVLAEDEDGNPVDGLVIDGEPVIP